MHWSGVFGVRWRSFGPASAHIIPLWSFAVGSSSFIFFLPFLTFRRRLPVRGSGSSKTFPSLTVSGPFLPDAPRFHVPPDRILPPQLWSSSRALPLHLHFDNCSLFSVSSLLLTWPNHSSILFLITIAICSTFTSSKIYSFLRCSNWPTPIAHRTIAISVVAVRLSYLTDIGQVSQPYSSVGRITVWYIRIFNFVGTFLSQITPLSSLHLDHVFATLLSTSLLASLHNSGQTSPVFGVT